MENRQSNTEDNEGLILSNLKTFYNATVVKTKSHLTKNKQADQNDRELMDLFLKYQMSFHRGKKGNLVEKE